MLQQEMGRPAVGWGREGPSDAAACSGGVGEVQGGRNIARDTPITYFFLSQLISFRNFVYLSRTRRQQKGPLFAAAAAAVPPDRCSAPPRPSRPSVRKLFGIFLKKPL